MVSRNKVIWSYFRIFIMCLILHFIMVLPIRRDIIYLFEIMTGIIIAAIFTLLPMIFAVNRWDQYYRVIYPIYEKEGFSDHFYEVALQYGKTLQKPRYKATYYVDLISFYHRTERYEDSVKAFLEVDTAYIASVKDSWKPSLKKLVMMFFNNGMYTCLKTGRLEDAQRMYRDGYDVLNKYEKSINVLDTLAEYHFQMKEYEKSIYYDQKIVAKGEMLPEVSKDATMRLKMAREAMKE